MAKHEAELYEQDYYAWTQHQAATLRDLATARWNGPLDLDHLASEVQASGKEQHAAAASHLTRLIEHLLKLTTSTSPAPCGASGVSPSASPAASSSAASA